MTESPEANEERPRAYPPQTTEGWYALHQIFRWDRPLLRANARLTDETARACAVLESLALPASGGWSAVVSLIGSRADVMFVHFRSTLDEIGEAQRAIAGVPMFDSLEPVYNFLSVTEAGLYHASARLAAEARERGGEVGDEQYREAMARLVEAERASAHVQRRLFPVQPPEMPYICFYPMSKRRAPGQNWYALPLEERSRLMMTHGMTGRGYAGRVMQVITGAIGLDAWEWGVTLFAGDPLVFKQIVTDMRFDEVSAQYADFGEFFVGKRIEARGWMEEVAQSISLSVDQKRLND